LTVALGGIGVGPVILALLENLKQADENQPWIRLFDKQSKRFETREILFGISVRKRADVFSRDCL
jgi:hypothetical protein